MSRETLPVGKLPADLLARLLSRAPLDDPRIVLGPGVGLDCAVIEAGGRLLVLKSDPITFVTEALGHYLALVNANDVATTGAVPRWLLVTLLLPEGTTTPELAERIMGQVYDACRAMQVSVVGGHTEITYGLTRPIAVGTLIGEVEPTRLVTPRGATPGDRILLTKGVPIEGTSILARELPERLRPALTEGEIQQARDFLFEPGIGVARDARIALAAGRVTAMHDPTEGGLATALWELAEASGHRLLVDPTAVPIPGLSARICETVGIDPLATIASGALLITAPAADAGPIRHALVGRGIPCSYIGEVMDGPPAVWQEKDAGIVPFARPARDELARVYGA